MHKMKSKKKTDAKNYKFILVCVTQQKNCERLINKATEIGKTNDAEIHVLHVAQENFTFLAGHSDSEALEYLFSVSKAVGANLTVIKSNNIIDAIVKYARDHKADCVILGKSPDESSENSFIRQISEHLDDADIVLIPSS